ncbi:MAG: metallophosphoesterase [Clostridia bacterium]|nr:metallophosphoesterase [Clostridia bacterium]
MNRPIRTLLTAFLLSAAVFLPPSTRAEQPPEAPFSVAWLSDTQAMIAYDDLRHRLNAQSDWLNEHAESENIRLILHTGDVTDNPWVPAQVRLAEEFFAALPKGIPALAVAGNHDLGVKKKRYEKWTEFSFVRDNPHARRYRDGEGVSTLPEAGGRKLLFVGLGFGNRNDEAYVWAREMFNAHPDATGVFFSHAYIDTLGDTLQEGRYFDKFLLPYCPNLRLVLCGHSRDTAHTVRRFTDEATGSERTVDIVMSNFQGNTAGYGALRLLRFAPAENRLVIDGVLPAPDATERERDKVRRAAISLEGFFS